MNSTHVRLAANDDLDFGELLLDIMQLARATWSLR